MSRASDQPGPLVTLLSDFGTRDAYVAEMKLALLHRLPRARLIDVTHAIAPQDVLGGSIQLDRAIAAAASGTAKKASAVNAGGAAGAFHLAVVDPGVGTDRRILVVQIAGQTVVCPDNGLITWPWRRRERVEPGRAYELIWRPESFRPTFHGRDIMAPALAMLAAGTPIGKLARPICDPILLDVHLAHSVGRIIHIDHFGNAITNIAGDSIAGQRIVRIGRRSIGPIRATYSDVAMGKQIALIGSAGLLEIAVRNGSAARKLSLHVGDEVKLVR